MRLTITVVTAYFLAPLLVMQCNAGMEDWWNDMWGGGNDKGKGRGRRRPGHYRPIVITAPAIFQHHHRQPMYKKQTSYGYRGSNFGGHSIGGHGHGLGHHSFGGMKSGHGSIGGISSSYGSSSLGHGAIHSFQPIQSGISYGNSFSSNHGGIGDISSVPSVSHGGNGYKKGGSSYGSSYGKSTHGFGPIKDDDLIIVLDGKDNGDHDYEVSHDSSSTGIGFESGGIAYSQELGSDDGHGGFITSYGDGVPNQVISHVTNHIDGGFGKEGRLIDLEPPPVYHAGSNALGDSYGDHSIDGGTAALIRVSSGSHVSDEIISHHSSPLPMAEHGTSSLTYLEETPVPLYPIHSGSEVKSFQPSKQIPFPGHQYDNHISQSIEIDDSYLGPHQSTAYSENAQAIVTYDAPLNYNDPIIEIVFEDAEPTYEPQSSFEFDPSLFQPQSDDVEVYFIEVSDDETYDSIDDLDLSQALAGVKEEFPEGLPSELSHTLLHSGYLDNAQIQVLDLDTALGDNSLDYSLRSALRDHYGSSSNNIATIVKPDTPLSKHNVELKLKRLIEDKNTLDGDFELAKTLSKFPGARYAGVVELNDKNSEKFLPVTVDGNRIPIPDHPSLLGKTISGVLVYADTDNSDNETQSTNVVLSTEAITHSRTGRQYRDRRPARNLETHEWVQGDWKPMPPYVSTEEKKNS